jgi:hypothetical protein
VAGLAERVRQLGPDTTASHDQDPHRRTGYKSGPAVTGSGAGEPEPRYA